MYFAPLWRGSHWNWVSSHGVKNLECWGYQMGKKFLARATCRTHSAEEFARLDLFTAEIHEFAHSVNGVTVNSGGSVPCRIIYPWYAPHSLSRSPFITQCSKVFVSFVGYSGRAGVVADKEQWEGEKASFHMSFDLLIENKDFDVRSWWSCVTGRRQSEASVFSLDTFLVSLFCWQNCCNVCKFYHTVCPHGKPSKCT